MKKCLLGFAMAALVAGGAFAQIPLSAGVGGYFTSDFGGGMKLSADGGFSNETKANYAGGGGFLFLDAFFAQLSFGFFGGGGSPESKQTFNGQTTTEKMDQSLTGMDIGLMGKYPIAVSDKLTVFPMLGMVYRIILSGSQTENGKETKWDGKTPDGSTQANPKAGDFSALWFRLGGGADFALTEQLYLRGALTYGIRLANKFEKDMADEFKKMMEAQGFTGIDASKRLGHGLDFSLGIGYKF